MKKTLSLLLAMLLMIASLTAVAEGRKGGTLVVSQISDPLSFNPNLVPDDAALLICMNIFNNLIAFDVEMNLLPDLADSWEFSEDGLALTLNLHEGVKWHDGEPFTSADVAFTLETIKNGGFSGASFTCITAIEMPDDNTVILRTETPNASLPYNLAYYGASILPKHIYEGTDWTQNPANMKPVGTGAFKFAENQPGVSVTLEANMDYFRGAPNVDKLIFSVIPDSTTAAQAFMNHEVDILGDYHMQPGDIPSYKANPDLQFLEIPFPSVAYIAMNFASEHTAKQEVRQAIALGVDRDEIVRKAQMGQGTPEYGFMTPVMAWAYNDQAQAPKRDVEAAIALLESAGYTRGADGYFFTLNMPTMNSPEFIAIATVLQDNLKEIGVNTTLNTYDIGAWATMCLVDHNFDIVVLSGNQGPDPSNFGARVTSTGQIQFMSYNNPDLDACFADALKVMDRESRSALYKKAQEILANDLPIISLTAGTANELSWGNIKNTPFMAVGEVAQGRYEKTSIE